jgi:hypothetical protein
MLHGTQRLKTAYWMEQVHHKVKEYYKLQAERTPHLQDTAEGAAGASNITAVNATTEATEALAGTLPARLRVLRLRGGAAANVSSSRIAGDAAQGSSRHQHQLDQQPQQETHGGSTSDERRVRALKGAVDEKPAQKAKKGWWLW